MDRERASRLFAAWKRTGLTQPQCVERFGWSRDTFKSNLNGNANFSFSRAQDYARAFGVRAEWLYANLGPMLPDRQSPRPAINVPILSWVQAGNLTATADIDQRDDGLTITISGLPSGGYNLGIFA